VGRLGYDAGRACQRRQADMSGQRLRVAVLGAGTVGREVVRAFQTHSERLVVAGGPRLELIGVAVRRLAAARDDGIDAGLLTDAPAHLVASPDADVVVELIGGDEPARTLIAAALGAGKSVVTANKHVIAHHGPALEAIARRTGAALRFEAAVGGGIPILGPLACELAANRIDRVRGILNGTTNYILSAMAADGRQYGEALAAAQAAGYAEADPAGDVEGADASNKLAILCRLAFGAWPDPGRIVRRLPAVVGDGPPGITGVTVHAIAGAAELGGTIKLIADARRLPDGRVAVSVLPTIVPLADPIGRTSGVTNRIEIRGDPIGSVAFSGPGAGGAATASAVLGDVLAIARGSGSTWAGLPPAAQAEPDTLMGPPDSAPDRGWFAVLPGHLRTLPPGKGQRKGQSRTALTSGGTAVQLSQVSLTDVLAWLRAAGAPDKVVVFPADERATGR
jgi:homoserine dehydrogenase